MIKDLLWEPINDEPVSLFTDIFIEEPEPEPEEKPKIMWRNWFGKKKNIPTHLEIR